MNRAALPLLLAAALAAGTPLHAQTDDEAAVRAVVVGLFDAMRAGDGDGVRARFTSDGRLQTAAPVPEGGAVLRETPVERFAASVESPRDEVWDERVDAWEVRVDGPLASVVTDYSFFVGERFSHCGINAFQLLRTAEGWKIFQLTDTRRRAGCAAAEGAQ
jgi:hypothetical protein